jgi:hypothetical protein
MAIEISEDTSYALTVTLEDYYSGAVGIHEDFFRKHHGYLVVVQKGPRDSYYTASLPDMPGICSHDYSLRAVKEQLVSVWESTSLP